MKVMIVDDEADYRFLLKRALEREDDYEVIEACSGKECLEKVRSEDPDLILLDIMMPGMDGWDVCKKIKADEKTRFIKVVMLSVMNSQADRVKSTYSRADLHVQKTPDFTAIVETINGLAAE